MKKNIRIFLAVLIAVSLAACGGGGGGSDIGSSSGSSTGSGAAGGSDGGGGGGGNPTPPKHREITVGAAVDGVEQTGLYVGEGFKENTDGTIEVRGSLNASGAVINLTASRNIDGHCLYIFSDVSGISFSTGKTNDIQDPAPFVTSARKAAVEKIQLPYGALYAVFYESGANTSLGSITLYGANRATKFTVLISTLKTI